MNLTEAKEFEELRDLENEYDLGIFASGYETRSTYLHEQLASLPVEIRKHVVIGFAGAKELKRKMNDAYYSKLGFEPNIFDADDFRSIAQCLKETEFMTGDEDDKRKSFKVLLDYSCMTKSWYGGLLSFLSTLEKKTELQVDFVYSYAKFSAPGVIASTKSIGPIVGFSNFSNSSKPILLLLGLGYEQGRASGITEFLDPAKAIAFYTKPAIDERFQNAVEKSNKDLLNSLGAENTYPYPATDLVRASNTLMSIIFGHKEDHRVIVMPLGPKPFALLSLLIALEHPFVEVWRATTAPIKVNKMKAKNMDRKPNGKISIVRVRFS